jgi:pyridoxamine 5'-phosphate oxidase
MDISTIRTDYKRHELLENSVSIDPAEQFGAWFDEAINSKVIEPNAMHLSTIGSNNRPTSRIVLLKGFDNNGFTFFTNYNSKKGNQLLHNNFASITFFWPELERQVRIEGSIQKIGEDESAKYFMERPRNSQIGAWASPQSKILLDRKELEDNFKKYEKEFEGKEILKPKNWGGYCLKPDYFEFWQGRASRLHDRIVYNLIGTTWQICRIAP